MVPREKSLRLQIQQLEQQAFLTNGHDDSDSVALNIANVRCSSLDEQVSILRAQLSAATAQLARFRSVGPAAAPAPNLTPAHTQAPPNIRHPSLHIQHRGSDPAVLSSAQGGLGGFLSAHSQEEWYEGGAPPTGNLQTLNTSAQYFSMCGGEAVNAPGVAPASFNHAPPVLGPRAPRPAEDPARFGPRPGVTLANLLGPRVAQPASADFHPHQAPPQQSPFMAPQRETMHQPGFQPPYQYAPGFKSMVSEISASEESR